MRSLQLPLRAGPAVLLLVLCLQLGFNKALENPRNVMNFDVDFPQRARANEEVTLKLKVQTELRECMVVKAHLQSNPQIEGSFNYKFTRCLCEDNPVTFFWDFQTNRTAKIAIVVDIINEKNICVEDISVVPNEANRYYTVRTLLIG
ncbi:prolactin-inducible protein [Marmota monax]|uniref:prolactin-inducible protein n=1 Tax=Marmota monax TaxID=9995 RepID=UPI001EAFAF50|nr:prolactin-inducible protein [Marmota monax]